MEKYNSISIHSHPNNTDLCLFFADEQGNDSNRLWLEMPNVEVAEMIYKIITDAHPHLIQYSA